MQYKFLVDDVWRVDEQQLCIRDSYGMINNVVFVTEQDILPPVLPTQHFLWNVSLDSTTIMPASSVGDFFFIICFLMFFLFWTQSSMICCHSEQASSSGGTREPSRQLAENDINALRYQLSVHLSASKAYDLMPDSGKVWMLLSCWIPFHMIFCCFHLNQDLHGSWIQVIVLDVDVAVRQAFDVMFKEVKNLHFSWKYFVCVVTLIYSFIFTITLKNWFLDTVYGVILLRLTNSYCFFKMCSVILFILLRKAVLRDGNWSLLLLLYKYQGSCSGASLGWAGHTDYGDVNCFRFHFDFVTGTYTYIILDDIFCNSCFFPL